MKKPSEIWEGKEAIEEHFQRIFGKFKMVEFKEKPKKEKCTQYPRIKKS